MDEGVLPADRRRSAKGAWGLALAAGLAGGVFVADLLTPRGIAVSLLHVPVMLLGWSLRRPRPILILLVLCAVLAVIGCVESPPGGPPWIALANRATSMLVLAAVGTWGIVGTRERMLRRGAALALALGAAALVFGLDLHMPMGTAVGALYVPVVLISLGLPGRHTLLGSAVLVTALTLLGAALSPPGGIPANALTNRALAILAVWTLAIFGLQRHRGTSGAAGDAVRRTPG